jgi:hypothetical protein
MKKASDQEKQNIDSVLALVEDQEQCVDDLPLQAPVVSETEKQEQCQAIVPYVAKNSSQPKAADSRSIFKKILEKKDSCPESPSPSKMTASVEHDQKAGASSHKVAVKKPLALQTFLGQQPKDPVLKEIQKHDTKKKKNKKKPAKKVAPKGQASEEEGCEPSCKSEAGSS